MVGGVAGAGLGAVLAGAVIRRRAEQVKEQLAEGGTVLWVSLGDAERNDAYYRYCGKRARETFMCTSSSANGL